MSYLVNNTNDDNIHVIALTNKASTSYLIILQQKLLYYCYHI